MDASMTFQTSDSVQNSSDDLIARAQRGDRDAFGMIFEIHHRSIYRFIHAMLGNADLAEELTQETFLGAYRGIASLRGDATLKTWLCSIAKNTVYGALRHKSNRLNRSDDELDSLDVADERGPAPDAAVMKKELNREVSAALSRLSEDKRMIFVLKEMQQFSFKEISEITGAAIPKLKTDLFRAKGEMREMLRPYLEANHEV